MNKHILSLKHKNSTISTNVEMSKYICCCGKKYKDRTGLWYHKKKCKTEITEDDQIFAFEKSEQNFVTFFQKGDTSTLDMNLIMQLLKQNDEFKGLMVEQNNKMMETFQEVCKNNNTNITNNGTINSHNKTFNLNVFLNEQCKDAMNIMEFVDSIKLDLSDAEMVGKLGYVNGISNIIIKHLKALDVHMRPVHCTDLKRETMYVKYQDIWEKEGDDNKLIRKAIKHIANKNHNAAETFREIHPDCMEYNSKHGDHFLKLRIEALGGSGNVDYDSHTKIIKKIAKEVTIDKTST
jgi:hypothetical protein